MSFGGTKARGMSKDFQKKEQDRKAGILDLDDFSADLFEFRFAALQYTVINRRRKMHLVTFFSQLILKAQNI